MTQTDTELIIKARDGDISAFEELVCRYDRKVLTIAAQFVHSAEDAKDIYQEVLIRVFKGLPKFKFRSEFPTWLYRITTNVCLTHSTNRRKHSRHSIDPSDDGTDGDEGHLRAIASDDPRPDERIIEAERADRLQEALLRLSPNQRMVVTLKHYQGLKVREIAEMMECSEGTVKKHLFIAMQRLRAALEADQRADLEADQRA
jgi:RNA polymerase sigma-70 factor, ECF subfamily